MITVLAGGTGGARLARGLLDVVGARELAVIANTGDDVEMYGVHVSPDPDLVAYTLADVIDERGWGVKGDTFEVMEALERVDRPAWFRLGDRDLAMCLLRTELLQAGERLTLAHAEVCRALGLEADVIPMSDDPVRTQVKVRGDWLPFQEFMIVEGGRDGTPEIEDVQLIGMDEAEPSPEAIAAIERSEAIILGPSNPVISIGPILAVSGIQETVADCGAPVVAVSPFIHGRSIKGPTEDFCRWAGLPLGTKCVFEAYSDLIDGAVADEPAGNLPVHVTETLMDSPDARRRLAEETLEFAATLAS
ncbi:MAG TPA: 2-phospho-L-lactate transferase [Thermoleophilaceae bacterium]